MKKTIWMLALLCTTLGTMGCSSKTSTPSEAKTTATSPDEGAQEDKAEADAPKTDAPKAPGAVTVTKEGTTFDPPITADEVPAGAFYCDMGTVHYARTEKGDGKCPSCGMALKHKSEGSDAHEHGEGEHDHH